MPVAEAKLEGIPADGIDLDDLDLGIHFLKRNFSVDIVDLPAHRAGAAPPQFEVAVLAEMAVLPLDYDAVGDALDRFGLHGFPLMGNARLVKALDRRRENVTFIPSHGNHPSHRRRTLDFDRLSSRLEFFPPFIAERHSPTFARTRHPLHLAHGRRHRAFIPERMGALVDVDRLFRVSVVFGGSFLDAPAISFGYASPHHVLRSLPSHPPHSPSTSLHAKMIFDA